MNDEDRKMIEEVEKLDAEATPGPWNTRDFMWAVTLPSRDLPFVARSRELLPALAKRFKEALADVEMLQGYREAWCSDVIQESIELAESLWPAIAKVSWVFGQNAIESESHLSKGEVAGIIYKKTFEEVLADLRLAVRALRQIEEDAPPNRGGDFASVALREIKTRGL